MIETRRPSARSPYVEDSALDSNESPIGPPLSAVQAAVDELPKLNRYPRRSRQKLIAAVAEKWGLDSQALIVTNGVDEAIDLVAPLADSVTCTVPGFDAFWTRPESLGIPVTRIPLDGDGQAVVSAQRTNAGSVAFIARPNNPTGTIISKLWIEELCQVASLVFVDETYIDFSCDPGLLGKIEQWNNLCVFRSLSKTLGLAGLRVGILISTPVLAAQLRERQRFYSVDSISLHAAAAAVTDDSYVDRHTEYVIGCRRYLAEVLQQSGLFVEVRETEANFVIARSTDAAAAVDIERRLDERDILVRECSLFGYPGRLRVSVGSSKDLQRLRSAIHEIAEETCVE